MKTVSKSINKTFTRILPSNIYSHSFIMGYCIPKTNYHLMAKSAQFGQLQAGGLR